MAIVERERSAGAEVSCVVQFGGQTPLKLALALQEAGVPILGTTPDSIDLAEDRKRFSELLRDLGVPQPASGTAVSREQAREEAERVGYPVVVRPSYVLGGRGMAIVFDPGSLDKYMTGAVDVSYDRPVLIDRFLEDAFEFDVDAVADRSGAVVIGGIMEHIEEAGIHSGDSSCVVPPFMVAERHLGTIREFTRRIARALKVVGLMNIQYAIKDDEVYVLEVNPRSSRTVPYISKATGTPMAKVAARVAAGRTLAELGLTDDLVAWGVFEVAGWGRAQGELRKQLLERASAQIAGMNGWLERELGARPYFNGDGFGYGDACAYPFIAGAAGQGNAPAPGSELATWLTRVRERPSARRCAADIANVQAGASMDALPQLVASGAFKREYRDHRLEWMLRSGGLSIVLEGMQKNNIRFSHEPT